MILDKNNQFASAASVAHAAGTILVGDVIDLAAAQDVGNGHPLYFIVTVDTSVITGGSAGTIQFVLASDAQAAIAVDGTATEHFLSHAFVTDDTGEDLVAGKMAVCIELPNGGDVTKYERYLGVLAVIATTTTTAGKINAFLTPDKHGWKANPAGI